MATFPLNFANANVPDGVGGASGYSYHHYGLHPFENLRLWRPTGWDIGTGFKNKPVLVYLHGGLGNTLGNNSLNHGAGGYVDTMHTTHGWPVVSIEYPPVSDNSDAKLEYPHSKLWPYALHSVARALAYLKANAAEDGQGHNNAETLWGVDGNGDVNSINPAAIVVGGFSYGATLAFLLAAVPPGALDLDRDLPLARPPFRYASSHVPRAVVGQDGQIDWTQFSFNGTQTLGTYRDNVHQVFSRRDDKTVWGDTYLSPGQVNKASNPVPMQHKESGSPWWWASKAYPSSKGVAVCGKWEKNPSTDPDQANLTAADWSPGTQRIAQDLGKAWYDPHLNWQAKPYETLLTGQGITNAILWGSSTTNPQPGLNLDDLNFNTFVPTWLVTTLGIV